MMVGITLLNDKNGDEMKSIIRQYREDSLQINTKILTEWIQGRGIPCTWNNLIYVLRLHCGTLADDVEQSM